MEEIKNLLTILLMVVLGVIFIVMIVDVGSIGTRDTDMTNSTNLVLNSSQNMSHILYTGSLHSLGTFETSNIIAYYSVNSLDTTNRTVTVYNNGTLLGTFVAVESPDGTTITTTEGYFTLPRYTGNLVNLTYGALVNAEDDVNCTSTRLAVIRYNSINRIIFGAICVLIALFAVAYAGKEYF